MSDCSTNALKAKRKTKSKSQIRAEAVERLEKLTAGAVNYMDVAASAAGVDGYACADAFKLALIDLLTDEPTNGDDGETNGIHVDAQLVDRDPVEIMRRVANGGEVTGNAMRKEVGGADWSDALLILADMVERDYVSREAYDDLRDEFVWTSTFLHRMGKKCGTKDVPLLVAYVEQLEAERDELQRQLETVSAPSGNLDAQSRAEIEDAERSANAAESHGDAQRAVLSADTDTDKGEGAKAAQTAQVCVDDEIVYGFEFCDKPDSTMLGETVFDSVGEPVGWIVANGVKDDCGHNADDGGRMTDMVNHPPHYTSGNIECIDAIQGTLTPEEFRGYCKGNALKYVWRERRKGHGEDIRKAEWYLTRMVNE